MTHLAPALAFVLLLATSPQLFAQRELIQIDEKRAELRWKQEAETQRKLDQRIDIDLTNTTLREAFDQLEKQFDIGLSVDQFNVERHFGIEPSKPFSVTIKDLPLRTGLDKILRTDARGLDWWIDGSLVVVSVDEIASEQMTTRVYDVSNVVERHSEPFPPVPGVGFSSLRPTDFDQHGNPRFTDQETLAAARSFDGKARTNNEVASAIGNFDSCFTTLSGTPHSKKGPTARKHALFAVQFLAERESIEDRDADNGAEKEHVNEERYYDFGPIIETIETHTGRQTWSSFGGSGELSEFFAGGKPLLVISQSRRVHEEIAALLFQLEQTSGVR